jgi:hypothetical protein
MKGILAVAVCMVAFCALSAVTFVKQSHVNHDICVAINQQNKAITDSLHRSLKATPTLAYYKAHPDELARVLAQIRQEIRVFAQKPC